jgi:hypothetical protein
LFLDSSENSEMDNDASPEAKKAEQVMKDTFKPIV